MGDEHRRKALRHKELAWYTNRMRTRHVDSKSLPGWTYQRSSQGLGAIPGASWATTIRPCADSRAVMRCFCSRWVVCRCGWFRAARFGRCDGPCIRASPEIRLGGSRERRSGDAAEDQHGRSRGNGRRAKPTRSDTTEMRRLVAIETQSQ